VRRVHGRAHRQAAWRVPMFADLRPCGWNLFHRPYSWFDLFMEKEGPPENLAEWQAVIAEMEPG
jgi:hypothetical protein